MTQLTWYVIYKTTHVETDQFYVGRHQTNNLDDGYQGSGNWVRSFDDTSVLQTEIVEYCEDAEHLKRREQHYIDLWFDDELCMNVSRLADGLHEHSDETKNLISVYRTGKEHSEETKTKISIKHQVDLFHKTALRYIKNIVRTLTAAISRQSYVTSLDPRKT